MNSQSVPGSNNDAKNDRSPNPANQGIATESQSHTHNSSLENNDGDSKSSSTNTVADMLFHLVWWQTINEEGQRVRRTHQHRRNSKAFLKAIENMSCLRLEPEDGIVVYIPCELIRSAIHRENKELLKAQEQGVQALVAVEHAEIVGYTKDEFALKMMSLFSDIPDINPTGWYPQSDTGLVHFMPLANEEKLEGIIKNAGLTLVKYNTNDKNQTMLVAISMLEIYLVRLLKLQCLESDNELINTKKAHEAHNAANSSATRTMTRAGHSTLHHLTQSTAQTGNSEPKSTLSSAEKKISLKNKIIDLFENITGEKLRCNYHKATKAKNATETTEAQEAFPPRFRLNGNRKNIEAIYNLIKKNIAEKEVYGLAKVAQRTNKTVNETFTINGFSFTRGVRKGPGGEFDNNDDNIIDILIPENRIQEFYDTLLSLSLKYRRMLREKNIAKEDSADSKSESKETDNDIDLMIWYHGKDAQGANCMFYNIWQKNSKTLLDNIKVKLCEEFTIGDTIIYVPTQLIREGIKEKKNKINKAKKTVTIKIGAPLLPNSLKKEIRLPCYNLSANQFGNEMIDKLTEISRPLSKSNPLQSWLLFEDNSSASYPILPNFKDELVDILNGAGLVHDIIDDSKVTGCFSIIVNLHILYIEKVLNLKLVVDKSELCDPIQTVNNTSTTSTACTTSIAGGNSIFTPSTQANSSEPNSTLTSSSTPRRKNG